MQCDVLVIGGGSAGMAAAVAGARAGARTILVERHGSLGGMATASLVHSICGLYLLPKNEEAVFANPGFATEFATRLIQTGGAAGPIRMGRVDVLMQHPTAFARLGDEIVSETRNLDVRLHTEVIGVTGRPSIEAVEVCCRGLREMIEPGVVVDASGDATAAALAGAEFEQVEGRRLQRPAFIFTLQGVEAAMVGDEARLKIAHRIVAAVRAGDLPAGALGASLRSSGRGGEVFVTIDLDSPPDMDFDPVSPACLTALEMHGRKLATSLADFLRGNVDGFSKSHVAAFPTRVGIRESRRVTGQYRLEERDILSGARFDDAVALATWPMEMREKATGARLRFPENGEPCEIPLRALRAKAVKNLFVAGRCISSSHEAQASVRVIGTCLATGEAAGLAASLLAAGDDCNASAVIEARERQARK